MIMYFSDFDGNGSTETIVCTEKEGKYYPLLNFDDLSTQIVSLRKKFSSYKDFAGKPIELVFDKQALEKAIELEVHELRSGYLRNDGNGFSFVPFNFLIIVKLEFVRHFLVAMTKPFTVSKRTSQLTQLPI